jgi:tetratricopeptide (TPR) repeat protein
MDTPLSLQKEISGIQAKVTSKNLVNFSNNIDNHLLLILVEDCLTHKIYSEQSLLKLKLKILMGTYFTEQAKSVASTIAADESIIKQIEEREIEGKEKLEKLKTSCDKYFKIFESEEFKYLTQSNRKSTDLFNELILDDSNAKNAEKDFQVVFDYAKCLYDHGKYQESIDILKDYIKVSKSSSFSGSKWGLLNSHILLGQYEHAFEVYNDMKEFTNKEKINDHERLFNKNMLLNTSLFLFSHAENPGRFISDIFSQNATILASASVHLIRYYISACLMVKNFDSLNSTILRIIQSDTYRYRDAFTVFIETLLEKFDYDSCVGMLKDLEKTCEEDFFLRNYTNGIISGAKHLIVSVYAMVFHEDDAKEFASGLGVNLTEDTEFKSEYESHDNLNDRLKGVMKAQVGLKDVLQNIL